MRRSKNYVKAGIINNTVNVDILQDGIMHKIEDEELTPIELTKLALYYSLNLENTPCIEPLKNI